MTCICVIPEACVHYNRNLEMASRLVGQQMDASIRVLCDQMRKIHYATVLSTTPVDAGLLDNADTF